MLMAENPPIKLARLSRKRFKCDFRQEANVRAYCMGKAHNLYLAENRKSELCAAPEWRAVENAAVEPSWALINNLLIYHSLSLKRRLQATEGCQQRRWRWADKTHSGGLLSAWRLVMEAIPERERERMKQREKMQTFFSFYVWTFLLAEQIIGSFPPSRHSAPVHLAVRLQNTMFQSFSKGNSRWISPVKASVGALDTDWEMHMYLGICPGSLKCSV